MYAFLVKYVDPLMPRMPDWLYCRYDRLMTRLQGPRS